MTSLPNRASFERLVDAAIAELENGAPDVNADGEIMVVIMMMVIYVVLGMAMEELTMVLLTIPIFYPMVMGLDFWGMSVPDKSVLFGILALTCDQLLRLIV